MSTALYPIFYVLIILGTWLLTSAGIVIYYNRKLRRQMIQDKVLEWNGKKP